MLVAALNFHREVLDLHALVHDIAIKRGLTWLGADQLHDATKLPRAELPEMKVRHRYVIDRLETLS